MKKVLMMLMLGVGVSAVLAEKVPVEVQQLIDSSMSGKHPFMVHFNMNVPHAAYKLSDLKAGEPIHFYWFFPDSVKKLGTNAPVSSIIKPLDEWGVPLLLNGKPKILLEISKSRTNPIWHIMGYGQGQIAKRCDRVRQLWPESAGYHPVFIGMITGFCYFYIPEKGDKNITYLSPYRRRTSDKGNIDTSFTSLDSSYIVMKEINFDFPVHFFEGGR